MTAVQPHGDPGPAALRSHLVGALDKSAAPRGPPDAPAAAQDGPLRDLLSQPQSPAKPSPVTFVSSF